MERTSYHDEHVWDYGAAKCRLSEECFVRWRALLGVRADDTSFDDIIGRESQRAAAHRDYMSLTRILDIICGPR